MEELWRRLRGSTPRTRVCFALGGGWLVFWAGMIFSQGVPYERDILVTILPLRQFFVDELRAGHWAEWFPYELLGVPFSGSIVASPFHPQVLLYLLLSSSVATKWALLLGSLLGLVGAYRLARVVGGSRVASVTAAYSFGLGGLAVSLSSNPTFTIPFLTAPWFLAASYRVARRGQWRDAVSAAVWWALIFLGGDVQLFLECGALGLAVVLIEGELEVSRLLRFAVSGLLAACLVAPELLPAWFVEGESVRARWIGSPLLAHAWAFHPIRLLDFVLPRFVPLYWRLDVGARLEGQPDLFASTLFVGATTVVLAGFGAFRRQRGAGLWLAVVVTGFWLAMGDRGRLLEAWWRVVPLFGKFRFPEKYLEMPALAFIPLVAWGTDRVLKAPRSFMILAMAVGAVFVLEGELVAPGTFVRWVNSALDLKYPFSGPVAVALNEGWSRGLLVSGAELLASGLVALLVLNGANKSAAALPAVLFIALWYGNSGRTPLASPRVVDDPGAFATALNNLRDPGQPPPRVIAANGGTKDRNLPDDELVRQIRLWLMADDSARGHVTAWGENSSADRARVMDLFSADRQRLTWPRLGVCFRVANNAEKPHFGENTITQLSNPYLALVHTNCKPLAWIASSAESVQDESQALQLTLRSVSEDSAIWEGGPRMGEGGGTVRWLEYEPEHLKLQSDAITESALVVGDAWATGWTATVDGQPAPIYPTDVASRGLVVPAGQHIVDMRYRAPGLALGVVLFLIGVMSCIALPLVARRRERVA